MTRSMTVNLLDSEGLRGLDPVQWDALSARSIDSNPFYARSFVLAGLGTIDANAGVRAVAIHRDGVLVGLFPFRLKRWPLLRAIAASNLYQASTQPLVHRDCARSVVAAWLDAIEARQIPRHWRFRNVDLSSEFLHLCQSLGANTLDFIPSNAYDRARLTRRAGGFEAHLQSAVSKSRVKDIQRSIRRLGEIGELRFERQRDPTLVARRIEDFLAIEHGGWKGRAGTSFLANTLHAEFARQAFRGDGGTTTSVDSLLLDGRPIAISVNLQSGDTIFTPKCAYDETYRKFSPGLVLEYLVVEAFYREEEGTEMDSSTTIGGHVVQGLWNCRKPMATVLIGPQGWQTNLLAYAQHSRVAARDSLKAAVGGDRALAFLALARSWRRKMQLIQHNVMVGGASVIQAVEVLVPAII